MNFLTIDASQPVASFSGHQGGPFTPESCYYLIQNSGGGNLEWHAGVAGPLAVWSPASGVGAGIARVQAWDTSLSPGLYTRQIEFSGNGGSLTLPAQLLVTASELVPFAEHSAAAFLYPGTNIITCRINIPASNEMYSALWKPILPAGWLLAGAAGDGSPEVHGGDIVFVGSLAARPLNFTYAVMVPPGETGTKPIQGRVEYYLNGMAYSSNVMASPNPLQAAVRSYHSADCDTNWLISGSELIAAQACWRAGAYHIDPNTCSGFAPSAGNTNGNRHSADYQAAFWQIDGTEMNRLLAYWRADGYHSDAQGADGFAPGRASAGTSRLKLGLDAPALRQGTPFVYLPGQSFEVTNFLTFKDAPLSLLFRPALPSGWGLVSVRGSGAPELVRGEIVWAGSIPAGSIQFIYTVNPTSDDPGTATWSSMLEYHLQGHANPSSHLTESIAVPTVRVAASVVEGQLSLRVFGRPKHGYIVQCSTDLKQWQSVTTVFPAPDGTVTLLLQMASDQLFLRALLNSE